jgi:hypothetical protein
VSNTTSHNDIEELLGAYALDAVDDDERDLVERHLLTCPRCRAEVEEHREVAALLAHDGSTAPPQLWDRIAGSLDSAPPAIQLAPHPVPPVDELAARRARRAGWATRAAVAVAAVAAIAVAVLGVQVRDLRHRNDRVEAAFASNSDLLAMDAMMGRPDTRLIALRGPSSTALAVVGPDGRGYLAAERLPGLSDDQTYQLWGKAGRSDVLISLGTLGRRPRVVPFRVTDDISALAVTAEQAPGVVHSSRLPVVAGAIDT